MAQIHMCLVLMLCDKPPFSIVSCPLGGLNFTVVPLAAVAVPPKPENRLPACVVVVPNRPPPPVDVLVAPNKPPPVLAVRTNQTCTYVQHKCQTCNKIRNFLLHVIVTFIQQYKLHKKNTQ